MTDMTGNSYSREEMIEPIERMFEREFESPYSMFSELAGPANSAKDADVAYIEGTYKNLHVVKLEESYAQCISDVNAGIHALSRIDANFRWLGVPLDSFRDGEREVNGLLHRMCSSRGIGILVVQPKGMGISAKVELEPRRVDGDFMGDFKRLRREWRQEVDVLREERYSTIDLD
ncbi:MAG: hypothetical protein AAGI01_13505 [Myxococcota bacterium]